jgi:hypothetical protein
MEPEVRRFLERERDRLNRLLEKAAANKAWIGQADPTQAIHSIKRSIDELEAVLTSTPNI